MHEKVSRTCLMSLNTSYTLPIIFLYKYLLLPTNPERVKSWEVTCCLCQHTKEAPAMFPACPMQSLLTSLLQYAQSFQ